MATVSDTIPVELQQHADAALAWFNTSQAVSYEVTGIVDAQQSIDSPEPRELHLVLCGGDACLKRSFLVAQGDAGFDVSSADGVADEPVSSGEPQAELDPPPGALRRWLDSTLLQHEFTLLIFYRGLW